MRKKGKSYQKVPPYKRYGASKPSNVNLSKKKKRPSLFMILFGIFFSSVSYCFDIHKIRHYYIYPYH
ncbi:hypothetical protein SAMN05421679_101456 [Epilithonimonas pallida]|uniref:Uncharacterized protein n=1 Tax=Epilithonimonas pallida TaxID=373671 RepID=A0ABY1R0J2_9FLAO|nr:hypothetical protein SAMN05421679_101456 [Epilithonimonas pallida]